jgi:hypothetical protein
MQSEHKNFPAISKNSGWPQCSQTVAAGILPAVEGGILPPGKKLRWA